MRVLNLTEGFEPYGNTGMIPIPHKKFIFSGGEPHVIIDTKGLPEFRNDEGHDSAVMLTVRLTSSDDVIFLRLALDALDRTGVFDHYELFIPYFPAARQDRVMVPGEPLSASVYADVINSMDLDRVAVYDPHSDVVPAIVDNCDVVDNHKFISKVLEDIGEDVVLVSPDAGAAKKVLKLAKAIGISEVIKCDKNREVSTGKILDFEVYANDLGGKSCLIADDICDGGGTFLGLADALKEKGAGNIYLAVSHGIFSKGFRELNKRFEGIYTTDSFPNIDDNEFMMRYDNQVGKVIQIKIKDVL